MENYESKIEQNLGPLFEDQKFMDFWKVQGQKLGYPFFVYDNGECGRNFVADNPQNQTCLKIYRSCSVKDDVSIFCDLTELLQDKENVLQEISSLVLSRKELSEQQECVLALFGSLKDVRSYLSYMRHFKMSAFKILVERDSFQFLEACVYLGLTIDQEIYLMRYGSKYLLSHYVEDYKLRPQIEIELVNRYDFELWDFYIKNGNFCQETCQYMRKLAETDEQVRMWLSRVCIY